jgi:hypothetical protein
VKKKQDN